MQILLGLPCPGCGLTRAGLRLLAGEFSGAWQMHPFIYVWMVFAGYICFWRYLCGRKVPYVTQLLILLVLGMLAYYVYRMLRYFPDIEPMTRKMPRIRY
jgi:hypothetical protein